MKIKMVKEKGVSGTRVEYHRAPDINAFRYAFLRTEIQKANQDVTIYIDTNQRVKNVKLYDFIGYLMKQGIRFEQIDLEPKEIKMFGLGMGSLFKSLKKQDRAVALVMQLPAAAFTETLFDLYLKHMDLAVCFGAKEEFEEVCDRFFADADSVLFNDAFFDDFIYDSVMCLSMRATCDVKETVKKIGI